MGQKPSFLLKGLVMHSDSQYGVVAAGGVSHYAERDSGARPHAGPLVHFRTGQVWEWYEEKRRGHTKERRDDITPGAGAVALPAAVEAPAGMAPVVEASAALAPAAEVFVASAAEVSPAAASAEVPAQQLEPALA